MTNNQDWVFAHIPEMTGKRVLISGANSGIGLETARAMASRGAEVILACRNATISSGLNERSVQEAMNDICRTCPQARLDHVELDLADLSSIKAAAERVNKHFERLDILINNAGVMWTPQSRTKDGFETHMGVNHLGHFALTALLLPALLKSPELRVVTVSSHTHLSARLDVGDLFYEKRKYSPPKAYAQSKLANLLFCRELGRRFDEADVRGLSVAAHPGASGTNLMVSAFPKTPFVRKMFTAGLSVSGQNPQNAAMPTLHAATNKSLANGDYIGPGGLLGLSGLPAPAYSTKISKDVKVARELWTMSEKLTGIRYDFLSRGC